MFLSILSVCLKVPSQLLGSQDCIWKQSTHLKFNISPQLSLTLYYENFYIIFRYHKCRLTNMSASGLPLLSKMALIFGADVKQKGSWKLQAPSLISSLKNTRKTSSTRCHMMKTYFFYDAFIVRFCIIDVVCETDMQRTEDNEEVPIMFLGLPLDIVVL